MNHMKKRLVLSFLVWIGMISAVLIPLEKTPLLWEVWGALSIDGLLCAGVFWRFTEGNKEKYLTHLLFPDFALPCLLASAVFSFVIGGLSCSGVWSMNLLWFAVVQVLIVGWVAIELFWVGAVQEIIMTEEENVQKNTRKWKEIRLQMENIASRASGERRMLLRGLAEMIRYSDPMTISAVFPLDEEIASQVFALKESIDKGDEKRLEMQCAQLERAVRERNARLTLKD